MSFGGTRSRPGKSAKRLSSNPLGTVSTFFLTRFCRVAQHSSMRGADHSGRLVAEEPGRQNCGAGRWAGGERRSSAAHRNRASGWKRDTAQHPFGRIHTRR